MARAIHFTIEAIICIHIWRLLTNQITISLERTFAYGDRGLARTFHMMKPLARNYQGFIPMASALYIKINSPSYERGPSMAYMSIQGPQITIEGPHPIGKGIFHLMIERALHIATNGTSHGRGCSKWQLMAHPIGCLSIHIKNETLQCIYEEWWPLHDGRVTYADWGLIQWWGPST